MAHIPPIHGEDPETLELSFGTDMSQEYQVDRLSYGDGYSQRARPGLNTTPQRWRLVWNKISDADAETLRLFFEGLAGVDLVEWTPYAQATELKWTANGWSAKPSGFLVQDCSITLSQEFDL
ncbi:MAG: phage tail protein [Allosphingosinicella sp.]